MSLTLSFQDLFASGDFTANDLAWLVGESQPLYERIQGEIREGKVGFAALPYQSDEEIGAITELALRVRNQFKNLVVIGIGGSDLGARAVQRALNHQFYNLKAQPHLFFVGDTTDPVALQEVLDVTPLKDTAFVVISKSGNTVEQMSTFVYVRQLLLDALGVEETKEHIIILTDEHTGTLREIVKREGYRSLVIPATVGGRFSVLTSVGLFPLAVAGVDIRGLLEGAKAMAEHDRTQTGMGNLPLIYAVSQMHSYRSGRPISVLMPYAYSLREMGFWFRQLWAESLGKKVDLEGTTIHVGPTPIAAVGPTDQHSQVQLYMEGPADKIFTFITVDEPAVNLTLPGAYPDLEGVSYLKGHDFAEILAAEQASTAYALAQAGRPSCVIRLPKLDAHAIGELLYFFELAVTYAGGILNINPFDQPGVEIGKQYMYGLLGRPGFEDKRFERNDTSHSIHS
ncbi:MAG: glucose-6-phosphate isomerase [bacterium]